jgi:hypothetical protein
MTSSDKPTRSGKKPADDIDMVVGIPAGNENITARKAGGLTDMRLPVSPLQHSVANALQNLAKAINLALQPEFLNTELEPVYNAAKIRDGYVEILHRDYIGLGDGVLAQIGKTAKSIQLTLKGPDAASPEGSKAFKDDAAPVSGLFNLLGRKLNFLQEFEDKVPTYVEQMLDRLEAANMITGWCRSEWEITTETVGLNVRIKPIAQNPGISGNEHA